MGASSDLGQLSSKTKRLGFEESRLSHYEIRAEGTLPLSITDSESKKEKRKKAIGFANI